MAGLRKGNCYSRKVERSYTRKSKYKKYAYIKSVPQNKIVRYKMGDQKKEFECEVNLVSKQEIQLRHNAIESTRQIVNRRLEKRLSNNYFFNVRMYPHHILRENKMITGAGADRMQTGMQLAFGRTIGLAAQVRRKQPIFTVKVNKDGVNYAKEALALSRPRLPGKYAIEIVNVVKN